MQIKLKLIFILFVLVLTEVYVTSNYLISALVLIYLLMQIWRYAKGRGKFCAFKIYAYLIAIIIMIVSNVFNQKNAEVKADLLVQNIETYKIKNSRYPSRLGDLAPALINKIPPARYSFFQNNFIYYCAREDVNNCVLSYTVVPPYYRKAYSFKDKRWKVVD